MPQCHCQNNCSWAARLIYRSTSVGLNLRVALPCLVDPLGSFGFQSCTAYAAKQRWNNSGGMPGNKQTQCTNCVVFVQSHNHPVPHTCANTCIDSVQWRQMRVCMHHADITAISAAVIPLTLSQIICVPPCPRLNHLLMDKNSQALSTNSYKRGSVVICRTSATNRQQLRNQHLDCEPLSGLERIGRSTASMKRNSCKLQIGKPLWEAALPFVVSFLLSSKCWHADVSSHSSCVITKMGERHKGMIPHYDALCCKQHTRAAQPACFIYGNFTTAKDLTPRSFGEASKPSPTRCKRQDNFLENNQCDQPWWYYIQGHSSLPVCREEKWGWTDRDSYQSHCRCLVERCHNRIQKLLLASRISLDEQSKKRSTEE